MDPEEFVNNLLQKEKKWKNWGTSFTTMPDEEATVELTLIIKFIIIIKIIHLYRHKALNQSTLIH